MSSGSFFCGQRGSALNAELLTLIAALMALNDMFVLSKDSESCRAWSHEEKLLMEEILHHLRCVKPFKEWDQLPIHWCMISSINMPLYIYMI